MGKMKESLAWGAAAAAGIGGIGYGTYKGLEALEPAMEKGRISAMVSGHQEEAKINQRSLQGVLSGIDRELNDPKTPEEVKNKLEVQKQAFQLAIQALEGAKAVPQEKK